MSAAARELGLPLSVIERGYARRHGLRIYYEVAGPEDAPPLMLVRGLGRSSSYWLEFREMLERERRVLVLDNRGVGRSGTPRLFWSTADMADDAAAVLAQSGVQRADVFGISLGGMIAQQLALRHPQQVGRLVLACTTPGGRRAERLSVAAALGLARASGLEPREGQRQTAGWVLSPDYLHRNPQIVDIWAAIASSEPRSRRGLIGQVWAAARHDTWDELHQVRSETLVLTGDADRLMPPRNSTRLAERIPGATLETVRGAGHDFPTERPVETASRVLAFCRPASAAC